MHSIKGLTALQFRNSREVWKFINDETCRTRGKEDIGLQLNIINNAFAEIVHDCSGLPLVSIYIALPVMLKTASPSRAVTLLDFYPIESSWG